MCRLFGLKSIIKTQVRQSLISAENAIKVQSGQHTDGWGVTYYEGKTPKIVKSTKAAYQDLLFDQVGESVVADTVIAHIRRATHGCVALENTHPFQFGRWVFAHNGHITTFVTHRQQLLDQVDSSLRPFILGNTDSETIFFVLLTQVMRHSRDLQTPITLDSLISAVRQGVELITSIVGPYCHEDGIKNGNYLSFVLSNGEIMLGHHGGKSLHVSTYKKNCQQKNICQAFNATCVGPSSSGKVSHLILASEPLQGENVWEPLQPGDIVGIDGDMILRKAS